MISRNEYDLVVCEAYEFVNWLMSGANSLLRQCITDEKTRAAIGKKTAQGTNVSNIRSFFELPVSFRKVIIARAIANYTKRTKTIQTPTGPITRTIRHSLTISPDIPDSAEEHFKGFGSWLYKSAEGRFHILLNREQMKTWQFAENVHVESQILRSILHEFGHCLFSPMARADHTEGEVPAFANRAQPEEEGKAWVFSLTILGLLLGEHGFLQRHGLGEEVNVDDAPSKAI